MSLIDVHNLSFGYEDRPVLTELSLAVENRSFWGIVGPNGSGKSTFLNLLAGQLKPRTGDIRIDGKPVSSFSSRQLASVLSMVRQEFVPVFGFTVLETVTMARFARQKSAIFEQAEDRQAVRAALAATETAAFADRPLGHLSGGERQRVFIARALAQETPLLLLDEPTNHLDLKHQVRIFDLLKQMQTEQGKTVVLVTHDLNLACQYCDRVLLLGSAGASFQGPPEQVLAAERIEAVFGVKGFEGRAGRQKFFIPMGQWTDKTAADND